jgi:Na+-transporting NADH:ubiquinone oxidoreductase subunit F
MPTILIAVSLFTTLVVSLSSALLLTRRRLGASGDVVLKINGQAERALQVTAGNTLLTSLSVHQVRVPSACGGKGTCGLCKVKVLGAGQLLPTERSFLSRGEIRSGVRLACQLKVKTDLDVHLPDELFELGEWPCTVVSNESVADFIKELVVQLPPGEAVPFKAGQYVQIQCPPHTIEYQHYNIGERFRGSWDRDDLWRYKSVCSEPVERAYSMASYPDEKGVLKFDIKICPPPYGSPEGTPPGIMSSYLFGLKAGDNITVSGPYGEFLATDNEAEMIFIGGGAGMAPLRSIIYDQLHRVGTRRRISYWYRAHSLRDALYRDDLEQLVREFDNFSFHLCLSKPEPEDNWTGYVGYIHDFLYDTYLKDHPAPEDCEYYLCGPRFLSIKVLELLAELGVERETIFYDNFAGEDKITEH